MTFEKYFDIPVTKSDLKDMHLRFGLPDSTGLFFLRVIQFNNGTVLVPKMNHLAGDGYSYFYLMSILAALSSDRFIPIKSFLSRTLQKPHHRRTALKEFVFPGLELESPPQAGSPVIEIVEIKKEAVRSTIKKASTSLNQRISANDILSAMALQKVVPLQTEVFDKMVRLTIPIDVRSKVGEFGPKFFGNGLMLFPIGLEKEKILNSTPEELASAIRKSMPALSRDRYILYLKELEALISEKKVGSLKPFDPETGCLVTNISRLPAEKLNFGGGVPALILPITVAKNSAAILSRGDNFILRFAY
ncbi:MAG: hypothetical protein JXB23_12020 [Candidatus Aminicenantes bacterium]|nr:hypothetical protein [Candidatus Aminicenantes bacterium]